MSVENHPFCILCQEFIIYEEFQNFHGKYAHTRCKNKYFESVQNARKHFQNALNSLIYSCYQLTEAMNYIDLFEKDPKLNISQAIGAVDHSLAMIKAGRKLQEENNVS